MHQRRHTYKRTGPYSVHPYTSIYVYIRVYTYIYRMDIIMIAPQYQRRRKQLAAELDALLEREADEWLADRGFESHMESRPRKALFQQLEQLDPERLVPIERICEGGVEVKRSPQLARSATHFFSRRLKSLSSSPMFFATIFATSEERLILSGACSR